MRKKKVTLCGVTWYKFNHSCHQVNFLRYSLTQQLFPDSLCPSLPPISIKSINDDLCCSHAFPSRPAMQCHTVPVSNFERCHLRYGFFFLFLLFRLTNNNPSPVHESSTAAVIHLAHNVSEVVFLIFLFDVLAVESPPNIAPISNFP